MKDEKKRNAGASESSSFILHPSSFTPILHPSSFPPRHAIRLRHPWEREPLDGGRVRYARRFNCPTNLDAHEHVWLVFDRFEQDAEVTLNGRPLGRFAAADCPHAFDITALLSPRNLLTVELSGTLGEVRLEIGA